MTKSRVVVFDHGTRRSQPPEPGRMKGVLAARPPCEVTIPSA